MKNLYRTIRNLAWAGLAWCAVVSAWGQDSGESQPSLGDVARQTRQENSSAPAAKELISEDDDGPDSTGIWRERLCIQPPIPCDQLSITLPKEPKWQRAADPPRPALIPVPGHSDDLSHAIRIYGAEGLEPRYQLDVTKRTFLQGWFARPEYFGEAARLLRDQHVKINNSDAAITEFTVETGAAKYRGLSVVAISAYGTYGFACTYRNEDAAVASSICDAIIKSATIQTLQPRRLTIFPGPNESPDPPRGADPD
jgi:hypothetical protein